MWREISTNQNSLLVLQRSMELQPTVQTKSREVYMQRVTKLFLLLFLLSVPVTNTFSEVPAVSVRSELSGERQTTDTVFMVSPDDFAFNQETAQSNVFQKRSAETVLLQKRAMAEFRGMVKKLKASGVRVITLASRRDTKTPDAVFPNNWFSVHKGGNGERVVAGYPMLAPNRRAERRVDELTGKLRENGIAVSKTIDFSRHEAEGKFLEGTGSMVLDRTHHIAYASLSPRTDRSVLADFADKLGYRPVTFSSYDSTGSLIYHTNVMMSVGERFAVVCTDAIRDEQERAAVLKELEQSGKTVITITLDQVRSMCGNILELRAKGKRIIVLSKTAYEHFTPQQKKILGGFGSLLPVDITTIETTGGGSARCMLGEVF